MKERSALSCPVTLIHIPRCMDVTIRPSCMGGGLLQWLSLMADLNHIITDV